MGEIFLTSVDFEGTQKGFDSNLKGTKSYSGIRNADVVIVTAGIPRKPGMDREDLLDINLNIMKDVASNIKNKHLMHLSL